MFKNHVNVNPKFKTGELVQENKISALKCIRNIRITIMNLIRRKSENQQGYALGVGTSSLNYCTNSL